ncbi:MAG: penicillin-binding protein [Bacteroidales bacterium]|nr:penicillin-binding protein [Bacteroidales bacterium]
MNRAFVVYALFVIAGIAVIARMVYLQYITTEDLKSEVKTFRVEEIEATRGSILACDGRTLSSSVPYYKIRMDCIVPEQSVFDMYKDSLAIALSEFFGDNPASWYKKRMETARAIKDRDISLGNRLVDHSELMIIKNFPLFRLGTLKGGFISEQKNKRKNPYDRLAYRTIGFININGKGVGIEESFDYYLKGTPGSQVVQKLLKDQWKTVDMDKIIQPKDGYDVQTTLNIDFQEAAEAALKEQLSLSDQFEGATAIVMEVKTGAIRAIANMRKDSNGNFDEVFNYAIGQATEPGSTFKLATLVALIEDGYVTLETPVDAGNGKWPYAGHTISDVTAGGYGQINVLKAFEKSSNVAFAKLAVEYYANNEKKFVDRINNMKLNEKFNLDLKGEARAVIYAPGDKSWSKLTLPLMGIGYATLLTPLHTLAFYNAIANGGKMMKPYFVENIQKNGVIEKRFEPVELSGSICSKSTLTLVHKALRGVVEEGTGRALNDKRYAISGKTGTARIAFNGAGYTDKEGYKRHQASFAGFFPSENPKYSAIVVLYTGRTRGNFYGGGWAAPVFKKIADKIYVSSPEWISPVEGNGSISGKSREILANLDSFKCDSIPQVKGLGIRDALYILENQGYKVRFSGKGKVISQSHIPGNDLDNKGLIYLQLSDYHEITRDTLKQQDTTDIR